MSNLKVCQHRKLIDIFDLFKIGRLDALVFSGGVGENSPELRVAVSQRCACLGFDQISGAKNSTARDKSESVINIGESSGGTLILVCKTNEEVPIVIIEPSAD